MPRAVERSGAIERFEHIQVVQPETGLSGRIVV